jgi:hypothetical protein
MAGKISRSPFNEGFDNTPWPSFPSVKTKYTRFHHVKGREAVYTGGTEATASVYLSVAFIYITKQIKLCVTS